MNGFRRSPGPSRVSVSRREARQAAGSRGCRLLGPSGGPFNPARGAKRYSGEAAACRLRPPPALNSLPPLVLYEPIMQEPGRSVHRACPSIACSDCSSDCRTVRGEPRDPYVVLHQRGIGDAPISIEGTQTPSSAGRRRLNDSFPSLHSKRKAMLHEDECALLRPRAWPAFD